MEATEARPQLFVVHRLRAGRQRGRQPERRPDHHEQYGEIKGAAARFLVVCITTRIVKTRPRQQRLSLLRYRNDIHPRLLVQLSTSNEGSCEVYTYRAKDLRHVHARLAFRAC